MDVTRDLGEKQVRAYLFCKSARFHKLKDSVSATLAIGNSGQSPATDVSIHGTVHVHEVGGRPSMPRVMSWVRSNPSETDCQPIMAGGETHETIYFFMPLNFSFEDEQDQKFRKAVFEGGNEVWFDLSIRWSDVFGKRHSLPVDLNGALGPSPSNRKAKRSRTGPLRSRMADNRFTDPQEREE
jgi:hypothetical protein